jgi:hypothetical protein
VGWAGKESKSRINSPGSDKRLLKFHKKTAAEIAAAVHSHSIARRTHGTSLFFLTGKKTFRHRIVHERACAFPKLIRTFSHACITL